MVKMGDNPSDLDSALYLEEEDTTHSDQVPLLALRNVANQGRVWGKGWLRPADLPNLIPELTEQLCENLSQNLTFVRSYWESRVGDSGAHGLHIGLVSVTLP